MNIPGQSRIYHGGGTGWRSGFSIPGPEGPAGPEGPEGPAGPEGPEGPAGPAGAAYIAHGASEGESFTTNVAFQEKLLVSFNATTGIRYKIECYCEMFSAADEDVETEMTVNTVQYCFGHFKNAPYADRWAQMDGGFYISDTLNGAIDVRINYRDGYGGGNAGIRRARILVTQLL